MQYQNMSTQYQQQHTGSTFAQQKPTQQSKWPIVSFQPLAMVTPPVDHHTKKGWLITITDTCHLILKSTVLCHILVAQQPPSALEFGGVSTYQKSAQSYEEDSSDSSEEDDYSTSSEDELDTLFDKLNIDDNKVEEVTIDGFNLKDVAKHEK